MAEKAILQDTEEAVLAVAEAARQETAEYTVAADEAAQRVAQAESRQDTAEETLDEVEDTADEGLDTVKETGERVGKRGSEVEEGAWGTMLVAAALRDLRPKHLPRPRVPLTLFRAPLTSRRTLLRTPAMAVASAWRAVRPPVWPESLVTLETVPWTSVVSSLTWFW